MSQEQHSVSQIPSFGSKVRPRAGSVSALPSSNSSQTSPHTKKKVVFVQFPICGVPNWVAKLWRPIRNEALIQFGGL